VNTLAGEELAGVKAIREDDARGRHTTSRRQLHRMPDGGLILDTPGMRELGLWDADAGVAATFADVEALIATCRFSDCAHATEPGCAVQAALADGSLEEGRWRNYGKLQRELSRLARKDDPREQAARRKVWVQRARHYRAQKRQRDEDP
jgi:ribosome biogenesis GTPase